jgi:hypothetical protein
MPADVTFLPADDLLADLRAALSRAASDNPYLISRLRLHCHLHDAGPMPVAALVMRYLQHLGYRAAAACELVEIEVERALEVVTAVFHHDVARNEELIPAEQAGELGALVRGIVEPWAVVALTGFSLPPGNVGALIGRPFVRVVADTGAEGGALFVGEGEIAMVWALDDDGPTRASYDIRPPARRRSGR